MNKLSIKVHTKKMKNIKKYEKGGTLWHDWLISFVPMLNLHRHVQLVCNPKTVKINFLSDIIDNIYVFLFLKKFTLI